MKESVVLIVVAFLSAAMCFAAGSKEPEWFSNYRSVYPNAEYLAQRGSGATAEDAETDAAAQLARYFSSTVSANLTATMTSFVSGSNFQQDTYVVDERSVNSEVEFIGLEFTESYYYPADKKWYAVAYVCRNDAWIQFRPKIEAEKALFYGFYTKAEAESDPYRKIALYKKAWDVSAGLVEKLEFGRIISPDDEEHYAADRKVMAELPSRIEQERKKMTVAVAVTGDYADIIGTAVKKALENSGFTVGSAGSYTAVVEVSSNEQGEDPLEIHPAVSVALSNASGESVFSYETRLAERTVAYTLENARKKAFPKLAAVISEELQF